ncbi:MAG TPA: alpha/beta hydrolase-fold protein [Bdellovibrio sp.]|nr:alpha/beta hydrolase-fold protein [Bdellovibrio sp.]
MKCLALLTTLSLGLSVVAHSEVQPTYHSDYSCDSETQQGLTFKYCIRHVDRSKNQDVIYFFHGLMGDEETWFTQTYGTGMLERKWHWRGYDPTIVTISFGEVWLLVDNHRFPLIPYFKHIIVPLLEKKIGGLGQGRRMAIGESMGGFNAVEAALKIPNFFSKVALLCPAITTVGPFSSEQEIQAYIDRTKAVPDRVRLALSISKQVFINEDDWMKHDPLRILRLYHGHKPNFYVSTGMQDDFGFQEGSEQFASLGKTDGYKTQWVPVAGGHCNFDRRTTADFIMEGAHL